MQIIYEGKDIVDDISVRSVEIIDRAGERLDTIILTVNNPENEWSGWKPTKNHMLEIKHNGFDSGVMYVVSIQQFSGYLKMMCLPIKDKGKETYTKSWEDVSLTELLQEVATKHGLTLDTYNIKNYTYTFLIQMNEADFAFLNRICVLEGYSLKINNGKLIVYDEASMESQVPIQINALDSIGEFRYTDGAIKTYGSARLGEYTYTNDEDGPVLEVNAQATSIGEAERFMKNSLRAINKHKKTMILPIKLNSGIAAGCVVNLTGFGLADGRYFVHEVIQQLSNDATVLNLRGL